ncbi:MAG: hypothetical protein DRP70_11375 [Spirochaetes bacterium]|nr:MAG: hypothetical protein DRP49_00500 [Spirochaetota bacterium]RKX81123.1 MAG: hypothetical protein DRP60_01465 [Spirochaetota bacterium]RKX85657.1 MAG: hypothetical protein DRP70_11375 [Spirochaetota bacterium]RKX97243.1 MAG: hypothetical protein DRZ90_06860 [Spirochaetota bacterium]
MITKENEWVINYIPEEGGRYTGKIKVSEEELRFVSLYESSNKTIVKAIFLDVATFASAGGHTVYRYSNNDEAIVALPAGEIANVTAAKKGLFKRAVITMKDGQVFVFDYGLLSVGKLVERIASVAEAAYPSPVI